MIYDKNNLAQLTAHLSGFQLYTCHSTYRHVYRTPPDKQLRYPIQAPWKLGEPALLTHLQPIPGLCTCPSNSDREDALFSPLYGVTEYLILLLLSPCFTNGGGVAEWEGYVTARIQGSLPRTSLGSPTPSPISYKENVTMCSITGVWWPWLTLRGHSHGNFPEKPSLPSGRHCYWVLGSLLLPSTFSSKEDTIACDLICLYASLLPRFCISQGQGCLLSYPFIFISTDSGMRHTPIPCTLKACMINMRQPLGGHNIQVQLIITCKDLT